MGIFNILRRAAMRRARKARRAAKAPPVASKYVQRVTPAYLRPKPVAVPFVTYGPTVRVAKPPARLPPSEAQKSRTARIRAEQKKIIERWKVRDALRRGSFMERRAKPDDDFQLIEPFPEGEGRGEGAKRAKPARAREARQEAVGKESVARRRKPALPDGEARPSAAKRMRKEAEKNRGEGVKRNCVERPDPNRSAAGSAPRTERQRQEDRDRREDRADRAKKEGRDRHWQPWC